MVTEDLHARFNSHAMSDETKCKADKVKAAIHELVDIIDIYCPTSREKSLALTHLEECSFWCNASLARNQ